jgi:prophage regulatory protein
MQMSEAARKTVDRRGDSLLRIADVRRRTGLSVATVYRREAAKTFPSKVQLGPKSVAWYSSDIDAFVADPMGYRA